jgi:hypothetical protein
MPFSQISKSGFEFNNNPKEIIDSFPFSNLFSPNSQVETRTESSSTFEYRMSQHGKSIKTLIQHVVEWGLQHRKVVLEDEIIL